MMTLTQRANLLQAQLENLTALTAAADEAAELAVLRNELHPKVHRLLAIGEARAMLSRGGVSVAEPAGLESVQRRGADLLKNFLAERSAATLKKGRAWKQLFEDVERASEALASEVEAGWQRFREELFSGETPRALAAQLAKTPANIDALDRYGRTYEQFKLTEDVPLREGDINEAKRLAEDLKAISKAFDFNVPDDVKLFLAKVQAGGAPLSLLTRGVQDWLKETNTADGYIVRAAMR